MADNNANDVTIVTTTAETPEPLQDTIQTQQIQPDFPKTVSYIQSLEHTLRFEIFEKIQVILLNWFAVQQQTSTSRHQKFRWFYSKFCVESSEFFCRF